LSEAISRERSSVFGVIAGDLMTYPSPHEVKLAKTELSKIHIGNDTRRPLSEIVERALRMKEAAYKNILRGSSKPVLLLMGNDDGILGEGQNGKVRTMSFS
jgi:hypothetical protein